MLFYLSLVCITETKSTLAFTLKMEAARSSETFVSCPITTRRQNIQDIDLNFHRRVNLLSRYFKKTSCLPISTLFGTFTRSYVKSQILRKSTHCVNVTAILTGWLTCSSEPIHTFLTPKNPSTCPASKKSLILQLFLSLETGIYLSQNMQNFC
jgi:hypothetical protein